MGVDVFPGITVQQKAELVVVRLSHIVVVGEQRRLGTVKTDHTTTVSAPFSTHTHTHTHLLRNLLTALGCREGSVVRVAEVSEFLLAIIVCHQLRLRSSEHSGSLESGAL